MLENYKMTCIGFFLKFLTISSKKLGFLTIEIVDQIKVALLDAPTLGQFNILATPNCATFCIVLVTFGF